MAVTAQFNEFHTAVDADNTRPGFFSRLMTRLSLVSEARAIHRLETEAAHLLGTEQLAQIKADFIERKAKAQI